MDDRLEELQKLAQGNPFGNEPEPEAAEPFLDEFFGKVDEIRTEMKQVRAFVIELKQDYAAALEQVDSKRKKKATTEIDDTVQKTNALANRIREELKLVAQHLPLDAPEDGLMTNERIMKNAYKSLQKEFISLMEEYQQIQKNYEEKSRQLATNAIKLENPDATAEEIEKAIELGPEQIFAQDRKRAAQEAYNYIQSRHDEILKIEKSLEEVHQMFLDMAVLVEEQSEVIDRISFQVQNVKKDVRIATEELREANKIQRRKCVIQ